MPTFIKLTYKLNGTETIVNANDIIFMLYDDSKDETVVQLKDYGAFKVKESVEEIVLAIELLKKV